MARMRWTVATVALGSALLISPHLSTLAAQTGQNARDGELGADNLDLAGTRYSTLDQINRTNVKR